MTTKAESRRAVAYTRDFLLMLIDPKKSPRVPRNIRLIARGLLKHYPYR